VLAHQCLSRHVADRFRAQLVVVAAVARSRLGETFSNLRATRRKDAENQRGLAFIIRVESCAKHGVLARRDDFVGSLPQSDEIVDSPVWVISARSVRARASQRRKTRKWKRTEPRCALGFGSPDTEAKRQNWCRRARAGPAQNARFRAGFDGVFPP
jgi:hypothetical protein